MSEVVFDTEFRDEFNEIIEKFKKEGKDSKRDSLDEFFTGKRSIKELGTQRKTYDEIYFELVDIALSILNSGGSSTVVKTALMSRESKSRRSYYSKRGGREKVISEAVLTAECLHANYKGTTGANVLMTFRTSDGMNVEKVRKKSLLCKLSPRNLSKHKSNLSQSHEATKIKGVNSILNFFNE